jgi:2-amino-4-hydroxy-6-hydroxymethyldihydropteridine diphosphokinase
MAGAGCVPTRISSIYETSYIGPDHGTQPLFLNCVVQAVAQMGPFGLLASLHEIELSGGRGSTRGWMPRTIDLDILLYGDITLESRDLTLPHPRMWDRAFVLVPLAELEPSLRCPSEATVAEQAKALTDQGQKVVRASVFPLCLC